MPNKIGFVINKQQVPPPPGWLEQLLLVGWVRRHTTPRATVALDSHAWWPDTEIRSFRAAHKYQVLYKVLRHNLHHHHPSKTHTKPQTLQREQEKISHLRTGTTKEQLTTFTKFQ